MRRHILLVGLPGAGKTTVGGMVARMLEVAFVDLDELIEREQGATVREIFTTRGESGFRALESEAARRVMDGEPGVMAPGGGWAAQPGAMDGAAGRCLIVYLRTRPAEAARRVGRARTRPLLAGADPEQRMIELLGAREEFYLRSEATVDTDGQTPEEVAREVVKLARSRAGW
jgi:shikimate kinase